VLAAEIGVSRGVIVEAYEQLAAEGYLVARPGGRTRVADIGPPRHAAAAIDDHGPVAWRIDLRPGQPDLTLFPREAWLRSTRRALASAPSRRFGYLDGRGTPELRRALAAHLTRARAIDASADSIVITSGFTQALALLASVLLARGVRRVAIEAPSFGQTIAILEGAGVEPVPVPVDDRGIAVDALDVADVDAVVVTPAHQYPTGVVLAAERRTELLEWAAARDAVIVEDDYDAEFRFDRHPVGALQGLDRERVAYIGTASKVLAPGLRLGWLVLPDELVSAVAAAKRSADMGSPVIDQLAFADLVERGEYARHLRQTRLVYRGRRDRLVDALARLAPSLTVTGISAGLHAFAWLPIGADAHAIVRACADRGVAIESFADGGRAGLAVGYAAATEAEIEHGVGVLAIAATSPRD
jgi:GntR family transcriptional regulator/MocR family aminotransferase